MSNKPDSTAAEQFLKTKSELMKRDWHKSIYVTPNTLAETMTEFATIEAAKEAQRFAEWCSHEGWYRDRFSGKWETNRYQQTQITTAELYEEFKRYKEAQSGKE